MRPRTIIKIETPEPLPLFPKNDGGRQLVFLKNEKSDQFKTPTTEDSLPLLGPIGTDHQKNKVKPFRKSIPLPTFESISTIENVMHIDTFDVNHYDYEEKLTKENNIAEFKTVIY